MQIVLLALGALAVYAIAKHTDNPVRQTANAPPTNPSGIRIDPKTGVISQDGGGISLNDVVADAKVAVGAAGAVSAGAAALGITGATTVPAAAAAAGAAPAAAAAAATEAAASGVAVGAPAAGEAASGAAAAAGTSAVAAIGIGVAAVGIIAAAVITGVFGESEEDKFRKAEADAETSLQHMPEGSVLLVTEQSAAVVARATSQAPIGQTHIVREY